jgi:predicted CxxxxCH...CXXCH cytochrome family protein
VQLFCHGGKDNQTGAPPVSTTGETATTVKAVGAHTTHVTTGKLHAAFDCVSCHTKPVDALTPGHVKPSPAVVLAPVGWDTNTTTCANACHGDFQGGNAANKPIWTQVDGTQATCGSCHVLPPKTGRHPATFAKHAAFGCSMCHDGMVDDAGTALLKVEQHVNVVKDVKIKVGGTWDPVGLTCAPACHGSKSW